MESIMTELRTIWDKYEPQRTAEQEARRLRSEASADLAALNERRAKAGLAQLSEYVICQSNLAQQGHQLGYFTPAKTWRDDMNEELLSAVTRRLE